MVYINREMSPFWEYFGLKVKFWLISKDSHERWYIIQSNIRLCFMAFQYLSFMNNVLQSLFYRLNVTRYSLFEKKKKNQTDLRSDDEHSIS